MARLKNALRALLGHDLAPDALDELADRIAALEGSQATREAEWLEWQERMLRTLRRLEGRAARERQLAERESEDDGLAIAKRTALAMKFSRAQNGS